MFPMLDNWSHFNDILVQRMFCYIRRCPWLDIPVLIWSPKLSSLTLSLSLSLSLSLTLALSYSLFLSHSLSYTLSLTLSLSLPLSLSLSLLHSLTLSLSSLAGLRRRDLHILHRWDVHQDVCDGDLWEGMLSLGNVEPARLLHRPGRVSCYGTHLFVVFLWNSMAASISDAFPSAKIRVHHLFPLTCPHTKFICIYKEGSVLRHTTDHWSWLETRQWIWSNSAGTLGNSTWLWCTPNRLEGKVGNVLGHTSGCWCWSGTGGRTWSASSGTGGCLGWSWSTPYRPWWNGECSKTY
jgi:hypothetical protein